ncbi:alpha/beta hydrolase-fold protein [Actinokineospora soli]
MLGGLGVGAGLLTGCQGQAPGIDPKTDLVLTKPPTSTAQPITTDRKLSTRGRAQEVDVVFIRPAGIPAGPIPVCVALHHKLGGARSFIDLGVPDVLTELARYTSAPFAIAAVDGGNWVDTRLDHPLRMLTEDLPEWLAYHDLASTPFAAIGLGEGGAGALNHARTTPGIRAVAAISPNLYEDWPSAETSKDYSDEAQWKASEPLRHTSEFSGRKIGVWCGTEDVDFLGTAKDFAQKVRATGKWTPGAHDAAYWKKVLPEALKFVGEQL